MGAMYVSNRESRQNRDRSRRGAARQSNAGIQPGMKKIMALTFLALVTASAYAQPNHHRRHHHRPYHHSHAVVVVR
jgi:hypothetical protein